MSVEDPGDSTVGYPNQEVGQRKTGVGRVGTGRESVAEDALAKPIEQNLKERLACIDAPLDGVTAMSPAHVVRKLLRFVTC